MLGPRDEADDRLDRVAAQPGEAVRRADVAAEDLREGRPVRDVEEAESAHLPMQLHRVEAIAKNPLGDAPRILIVRLSALGDVIHGVPVACALRDAFPRATIGWVVEGRTAELLEAHPAIDHVIRAPRGWLKSPRAVLALRRELRFHHFEIAIDLQCLTKSAIAAKLSGAPRRIGKAGSDGEVPGAPPAAPLGLRKYRKNSDSGDSTMVVLLPSKALE